MIASEFAAMKTKPKTKQVRVIELPRPVIKILLKRKLAKERADGGFDLTAAGQRFVNRCIREFVADFPNVNGRKDSVTAVRGQRGTYKHKRHS